MFRKPRKQAEKSAPPPPCAACGQPSSAGFWDTTLCDRCLAAWNLQGPRLHAAELAHADEHPEDVELRGEHQTLTTGETDGRWVILKGDLSTRLARSVAMGWLEQQRRRMRGAA